MDITGKIRELEFQALIFADRLGARRDAAWNETKHPRASDGKFGSGGVSIPHHDNDFSDVGKLNGAELKPGFRHVTELPFPGDTKLAAVLADLEKNNPDWKLDLIDIKPSRVPVDKLVSMQPSVDQKAVEHYEHSGPGVNDHGEKNGPMTVIEHGGKYYIRNGTHRAVAAIRNGASDVDARVVKA